MSLLESEKKLAGDKGQAVGKQAANKLKWPPLLERRSRIGKRQSSSSR